MPAVIDARDRFKSPDERDGDRLDSIASQVGIGVDGFEYTKLLDSLIVKPISEIEQEKRDGTSSRDS